MILRKKYHTLRSNKVRFFCDQPPETGYRGSGVHPGNTNGEDHRQRILSVWADPNI